MQAQVIHPPAAQIAPAIDRLPLPSLGAVWSVIEGILFYGILAVGIGVPIGSAIYIELFR